MNKLKLTENMLVSVAYIYLQNGVIVTCKQTNVVRIFGGWNTIEELFEEFFNSFNEATTFNAAINYFTPNIGTYVINN